MDKMNIVYALIELEANRIEAYNKLKSVGLDSDELTDRLRQTSYGDPTDIIASILDLGNGKEHLDDVIYEVVNTYGTKNGKEIYEMFLAEVEALDNGKAILHDSNGRRIVSN